ncbi:uncharacterized protein MONOS_10525 [Monocercomonoides exilis]|uniref:uncharacterized protein n=1 Tax=Monocercomonoides exilis TaxID=2049356 RepID=UPI003559C4C8|nr:hypothetical protein MONOS_10525 [Monocercomonoides exilis]|eukprot:MONOS_10525.1-p1 / transcript=MONOS_10525.1 / gene=MONOS_10525 / organism=Monocercomonoides_exilis_PA203 / gene_product=unspecified product / transcript_product=unspecified product / location=Mono_scaffold00482:6429-8187(-) / protein_length=370 / sequence_SO=supercontig / SO=protein_coding / is_pseudo=false
MLDIEAKNDLIHRASLEMEEREKHYKDVIENYKTIANDLATTRTTLADSEKTCIELRTTINSQESTIEQLSQKLKETEDANATLGVALQQFHTHFQQQSREIETAQSVLNEEEKRTEESHREIDALTLVVEQLTERQRQAEAEIGRLMGENEILKERLEEAEAAEKASKGILERERDRSGGLDGILVATRNEMAELTGKVEGMEADINEKREKIEQMQRTLLEKDRAITAILDQQHSSAKELAETRKELAEALQVKEVVNENERKRRIEHKQLTATIQQLKEALDHSRHEVAILNEELEKTKQKEAIAKTRMQTEYEKRIADLDADLETLRFRYKQLSSDTTRLQQLSSFGRIMPLPSVTSPTTSSFHS